MAWRLSGHALVWAALLGTFSMAQANVQLSTPQAVSTSSMEQRFEERALRTRAGSYLRRFDDDRRDGECRALYQVRLKNGSTDCIRVRGR